MGEWGKESNKKILMAHEHLKNDFILILVAVFTFLYRFYIVGHNGCWWERLEKGKEGKGTRNREAVEVKVEK